MKVVYSLCNSISTCKAVMNLQVLVSTGQLLLASALLKEILSSLKPLLVDSSGKEVSHDIWPRGLKKPVSEDSFEADNAGTNQSRFVLPYHTGQV
jgi:hypothetical protein